MSLSYHPLHLMDVFVRAVAVHRGPALPVTLWHGFEIVRRPVVTEPVPNLWILNQPIDPSLKMLLLGQIDPVDLGGLHLLLQHLRTKKNYICM
jgi:hypothetical protein